MGDLIGSTVETELYYIKKEEFERVRRLNAPKEAIVGLFADMARLNTLYMIAKAGSGHIGSSFSALDIVSYLYLSEMEQKNDVFFSSKGHDAPALYAVLMALGVIPEENIHRLRRLDGLPGHPDISVEGLVANTGSLGMGISKAKGMIRANRLEGRKVRVFVMTGDGELQEGQIWESLVSAANDRLSELTVIVDHNKFQSDLSVARTSDLGNLNEKFSAFGWHVERTDGHDLSALSRIFEGLRAVTDRPKVVIADTIKGKGVAFMQGTAIDSDVEMFRFHSGAPKADEYLKAVEEIETRIASVLQTIGSASIHVTRTERPVVATPPDRMRRLFPAYEVALLNAAECRPDLVVLDADLALDMSLLTFKSRFPDRFFECGIAEQDMVSQAGGMALKGLTPIVHSFSCFLSTRPNEQIYTNATERTRVVHVGGLSGVVPAAPGHSHQSVREISALGGIPGMVMVEPCCPEEVGPLFRWCIEEHDGPSFVRLVSVPYATHATLPVGYKPRKGRGFALRSGEHGIIVSSGLVGVAEALNAAEILAGDGIQYGVVALSWLNVIDRDWLRELAAATPALVTFENHYVTGGQGQMLLANLATLGLTRMPRCLAIGIEDIPPSGQNGEVLARLGLDGPGLARRIARFHRQSLNHGATVHLEPPG
jgi:transketolase